MDVAQQIMHLHYEASRRGALSLWTIFDHPTDYPNSYVARRFETTKEGAVATKDVIEGELEAIRKAFQRAGLWCMSRNRDDDARIVETWL